jgi:hypothetical protein
MAQFDLLLQRGAEVVTSVGRVGTVGTLLGIWLEVRRHPKLTCGFVPDEKASFGRRLRREQIGQVRSCIACFAQK